MRKRYSRSYTVLSFLTMFSYRELPSGGRFFCCARAKKAGTSVGFVSARIDFQNLSQFYCTLFLAWLREILVAQKKFFIFSHITY